MGLFDFLKKAKELKDTLERQAAGQRNDQRGNAGAAGRRETVRQKQAQAQTRRTQAEPGMKNRFGASYDRPAPEHAFGVYARRQEGDFSWFDPYAYEENNLWGSGLNVKDYFAGVFARYLPEYTVKRDVEIPDPQSTRRRMHTVDFMFYRNGVLTGIVLLSPRSDRGESRRRTVDDYCGRHGIAYTEFYEYMANYESYVAGRTRDMLESAGQMH